MTAVSSALCGRIGRVSIWALLAIPALLHLMQQLPLTATNDAIRDISYYEGRPGSISSLIVDAAPVASKAKQEPQKKSRFFNAKKQTEKAARASQTKDVPKAAAGKGDASPAASGPTTKVNLDKLPAIESVFEDLGLTHRMRHFIKAGFSETRHLLRLTKMDLNIISFELEDYIENEFKPLLDILPKLISGATEIIEAPNPEHLERKKLNHGRLYIRGFVQSFEYIQASFGSTPPMGEYDLVFPSDEYGCTAYDTRLTNKIVIVKRGNCTFYQKATLAFAANISVLAVVNNEDRLESPASGLGIVKEIKETDLKVIAALSVIALANTSYIPLVTSNASHAARSSSSPLRGAVVPLKCGKGGACEAVVDEEKKLQNEVSSGRITLASSGSDSHQCDFLSSTFGGLLEANHILDVVMAEPINGCLPLEVEKMSGFHPGAAVVIVRGGCNFGVKALNAFNAGAGLVVFTDPADSALQRPGALHPDVGYVGIPSIFVTSSCAHELSTRLSGSSCTIATAEGNVNNCPAGIARNAVSLTLHPSDSPLLASKWIEVALSEFVDNKEDLRVQIEGMAEKYQGDEEIVAWLRRKLEGPKNAIFA